MDPYTIGLDPETGKYCTLYLFADVENIEDVRKKVIAGKLLCCIVKASLIVDPFQVVVAANKAALTEKYGQLTTKSVYTEILFCLSTSKNISRSLMEFGINDKDRTIIVVMIHESKNLATISNLISNEIKGKNIPILRLSEFTNFELVKKTYDINKEELAVSSYTDSVVSRISSKDFSVLK